MTSILIADDHELLRRGLKSILAEAFPDLAAGEAANAAQALEAVQKKHWDVVLLDINMPGRSGLDALQAMRAHLRTVLAQEPGLRLAGEAENGADAMQFFFRYRPDVVLLDVCLPDRNGFEVMQCFKQASPGCAVILLSDSPDPCVDEVSQMLGATEVCHKASELNRIRDILRRLVDSRSAVAA
jgi:YesN/AraC family two-component response regulator